MKIIVDLLLGMAAVSLIVGIISRGMLKPLLWCNLEANAFLGFTIACLLFAIAFGVRALVRK